jgi:hypothetical protein
MGVTHKVYIDKFNDVFLNAEVMLKEKYPPYWKISQDSSGLSTKMKIKIISVFWEDLYDIGISCDVDGNLTADFTSEQEFTAFMLRWS